VITPSIDRGHGRASTPPRETITGERVIILVEEDWRTRHFICTVLKYSTDARVFQSSRPQHALVLARELERPLDLLISNVDLADTKTGLDLARAMVANNPSTRVLLLSRRELPPCDIPPTWPFLSIPFPTAAFLSCVSELCCAVDPAMAPGTPHNNP
jgi:hypothetical protein